MAFRLPAGLAVGGRYQAVSPGDVAVLEEAMPPRSRVLVALVFAARYDGFLEDCDRAEAALREAGIPAWPERDRLVVADPDGEPVAWVSYVSSPAWWTLILVAIGGVFLLPVLTALPVKIIDWLFPGTMEIITSVAVLAMMGGVMLFMPKMTRPAGEKK